MSAELLHLRDQRTQPATISSDECKCVNRDDARHFQVVDHQVLVSLSGSSGGSSWYVPVIADIHVDEKSGIRATPNKKELPQGLCFCVYPSLLFVAKQPHPKPIFLDSTCGLPKGLEENSPVPASNGHCWSRAVSGKVDLFFFLTTSSPCCVFSTPLQVFNAQPSAPWRSS